MEELEGKKYILWDMDGVLINSEPQHYRAWKKACKKLFGLQDIEWDKYKGCIGTTNQITAEILDKAYGIDILKPGAMSYYNECKLMVEAEEGLAITPYVCEVLRALKTAGYKMAVASSSDQTYIESVVKGMGTEDSFELLFSGERVAHSKPAPDTFLEAARLLGAKPEECIVIEDSCNGTKAAEAAGMYCIGYVNPGSGDQDLSRADVLIQGMDELFDLFGVSRG